MAEEKELSKHPIKHGTQYIKELLEKQAKEEMMSKLTFAVRDNALLVTCKEIDVYKVLKKCELKVNKEYIEKLGLRGIQFQYDRYYLVLKLINDFLKAGKKEFSIQEMVEEVNKYTPARTQQMVRDILAFYATDYRPYYKMTNHPEELAEIRGLAALVSRQKNGVYQILTTVKALKTLKDEASRKDKYSCCG